jgi:hypothetical protein
MSDTINLLHGLSGGGLLVALLAISRVGGTKTVACYCE